ncbi:protein turtle homolog B-like [Tachysurus ichikawai]
MKTDTVVSSVSSTENTVLLQTAKAWTEGPGGRKIVQCLIDGGSQRSFVHERLVRSLQLPVLRQETLNLHTFGSPNSVMTKRNTVKIILDNVWNTQQKLEIDAIETPQVSSALMKVPDDHIQRPMKEKGLQLADFPLEGADPELLVLIGADFY